MSNIEDEPPPVLLPCTICSRTFRPEVLERHVKVCEKSATKKRRVFDSFKNRVSGTELEEFLGPAPLPGQVQKRPVKSPVKKKGPPKWKETHANLIAVLRAARGAEPPPDMVVETNKHAGNEQCPSCNRFFGPRAFDRHVEFCKEKTARIKMTPSKVSQAQERLEARTKYRAPLSIKPKITVKEKYSPMPVRKDSTETCSVSSTKTSPPVPTANRNSKSVKQSSSNFSRQSPLRSSERQRSVSPLKKSVVSNSKFSNRNEAKSSNQPKIKENLKDPEDLRPKTGTKNTTQEKIRSSYLKLPQLEDENPRKTQSKSKKKASVPKSNVPSDDESIRTVESEREKHRPVRCKWSSSESISKVFTKQQRKETIFEAKSSDDEKIMTARGVEGDKVKPKGNGDDSKLGKKSKKQKNPLVNDLSVNDESFGIVVAPCSFRPASSKASRTSLKPKKESEKPKLQMKKEKVVQHSDAEEDYSIEIDKVNVKASKNKTKAATLIVEAKSTQDEISQFSSKVTREAKIKKGSKIPKAKVEVTKTSVGKKNFDGDEFIEINQSKELPGENFAAHKCEDSEESFHLADGPFTEETQEREDVFKKKLKKWQVQKVSDLTTEELAELAQSFDMETEEPASVDELSHSVIWDLAAEQLLKSEESVHTTSLISVDSLNEHANKNTEVSNDFDKPGPGGDDFIVLHVTDPAKLIENDADMKLSLSEPCFPYSNKIQKQKEKQIHQIQSDVVVFSAIPGSIQPKIFHRKRKKKKTKKPKTAPTLGMREKTFLANDLPKPKRRKMEDDEQESRWDLKNLSNYFFGASSKDEFNERKKKFIESLKAQREKIRKWQITANSHMKYMEEVEKSIEDDLINLKNISKGKKMDQKPRLTEFKKKEIKGSIGKKKDWRKDVKKAEAEAKMNRKRFEYFEISLDDIELNAETSEKITPVTNTKADVEERKDIMKERNKLGEGDVKDSNLFSQLEKLKSQEQRQVTKFEGFEISNDDVKKPKRQKSVKQESLGSKTKQENTNSKRPGDGSDEMLGYATKNKIYVARSGNTSEQRAIAVELQRNGSLEGVKRELKGIKKSVKEETNPVEFIEKLELGIEKDDDLAVADSGPVKSHQNSSLENIEEVDEEEEDKSVEEPINPFARDIEIEDFIISTPDTRKILSKNENCLDELFPKPRKITETVTAADSTTAVRLGFTANTVFDLKSKENQNVEVPSQVSTRNRILEKRIQKKSQLPQILVKNEDKNKKSMLSLIELWKSKRDTAENGKQYKMKATLPSRKLAPLTYKNSFQIEGDVNDSYDPFKQAERQMLALLSWPSTVDIKSAKDFTPKPKSNPQQKANLETSPTSAFSKYPNKDEKSGKKPETKNNLNETFDVNDTAKKNNRNEKPTYTAADDWEEIFEKHFDLNRNEMTEQMTKSVKSALDGLLKNSVKNSSDKTTPSPKNKNDMTDSSIITEALYTSTPKQNSRSEKTRSRDSTTDLDQTPNTYRKGSNFSYGRITPPEDFNDSYGKGKRDSKANRNSGISLSSLSFCSQISDTTLADEEVMRSNLEIIGKAAAAAASRTPRRKYARSQSVFDERNKMLFAKTYDPNFSSSDDETSSKISDKPEKKSPTRNPYPKSVPPHVYRSQSVMEDRCKGDGDHSDEGDHISSPESNRNRKAKLSGDSAYSSLNRRSPRQNAVPNQQGDRLSSSGSENSLPAINNDYGLKPKSLDFTNSTQKKEQPVKMSKFCHECGSKYPVAEAKFCCECGVRRLII